MHIKHIIDFEGVQILAHIFDIMPRIQLKKKLEKGVLIWFEGNYIEISQNGRNITPKSVDGINYLYINWSENEFRKVKAILKERNLLMSGCKGNQIRIRCIPQIVFEVPKTEDKEFVSQPI